MFPEEVRLALGKLLLAQATKCKHLPARIVREQLTIPARLERVPVRLVRLPPAVLRIKPYLQLVTMGVVIGVIHA